MANEKALQSYLKKCVEATITVYEHSDGSELYVGLIGDKEVWQLQFLPEHLKMVRKGYRTYFGWRHPKRFDSKGHDAIIDAILPRCVALMQ